MAEQSGTIELSRFGIEFGAASDKGLERAENEDSFSIAAECGFFVLSDGMGGHAGGEIASKAVVDNACEEIGAQIDKIRTLGPDSIRKRLSKMLRNINKDVLAQSKTEDGEHGMGATAVIALVQGERFYCGNVGDSRAYLLRKNRLRQISRDHSVVESLVRAGHIGPEQAPTHPAQGQLNHFIGKPGRIKTFVRSRQIQCGDVLLLCSDGLYDMLSEEAIKEILSTDKDLKDICRELIARSNSAGGYDNITVVLIKFK